MSKIDLQPIIEYMVEETDKGTSNEVIDSGLISNGWSEENIKSAKKIIRLEKFGVKFYALYYSLFFLGAGWMANVIFVINRLTTYEEGMVLLWGTLLFSGTIGPVIFKFFNKKKPSIIISLILLLILLLICVYEVLYGYAYQNLLRDLFLPCLFFGSTFFFSTILMQFKGNEEENSKIQLETNFISRLLKNIFIILSGTPIIYFFIAFSFCGMSGPEAHAQCGDLIILSSLLIVSSISWFALIIDIFIPHITNKIKLFLSVSNLFLFWFIPLLMMVLYSYSVKSAIVHIFLQLVTI